MPIWLKQSTASQEIPLGYFLDSTDGDTEETALTIANTDIKIWKTGATTLANKNSGGATHISNGIYYCTLDATDTNTLGPMVVFVHESGALATKVECLVLPANVYDSLVGGSDNLQVDTTQWLGTAVTLSGTSKPEVDIYSISSDQVAANNMESDYDGTGYNKSNSTIGTCTTNTDMVAAAPTAAAVADAVWDESTTGHTTAGTFGEQVKTDIDAILVDTNSLNDTKVPDTISLANINAQVDTALTDIHLDHLFAANYDPAAKPGSATALLNEIVENDGGVSRFTANALEQAPDTDHTGTGTGLTAIPWNSAWDAEVQSECNDALVANGLDHLLAASVTGTDVTDDSVMARLVSASATADWDDYVNTTDSLQAIRDRGDAAWTTGGGGSISDILNIQPLIPNDIDLANTAAFRIGLMLINSLDDLPTTAEITPGTISIDRKAIGGTSWTSVVTDAACSESAGLIYYDEVFDSGTGYAEGDSIRITLKSQKITVSANDYEITDATGRIFYTSIRQTMRGTDSAYTGTPPTAAAIADSVWDEALSGHQTAGSAGRSLTLSGVILSETTLTGTPTTTVFRLSAGSSTDDFYNDMELVFVDGNAGGLSRVITDYNGTTKDVTIDEALPVTPASGDAVVIRTEHKHSQSQIAVATRQEMDSNSTQLAAIVADTNELQTNYTSTRAGYLDNINNSALQTTTAQTGDSYARLGAPVGASISADIATVDGNVDSILTDTNELQGDWTNGGRLDLLLDAIKAVTDNIPASGALNNLSAADVNAQVLDVLNTDTFSELSSIPAASTTLTNMVRLLYSMARNKTTQTSSTYTLRNDADSGNIGTATVSDDGTTFTKGEMS